MIYTHLAAALVSAGLAFAGGWWVNGWRHDSAELQRQQQAAQGARRAAAQADRAAESFQARQEAAQAREAVVTKEVLRVIQKPVYLERCLDDDGMRILSDDANASNARRGLTPAVPAAATSN